MRIDNNGNIISENDNFCPYCDADLNSGSYEYCDKCGEYVGFIGNPPGQTITVECLNCGETNDITNNICTNCGENPTNGLLRCKDETYHIEELECKCTNCGEYNPITNETCRYCDEKLNFTLNIN